MRGSRSGWRYATLLLGACLLGACGSNSSAPEAEPETAAPLGNQACFFRGQSQNFEVLSRSSLVVFAPTRSNAYLVRISPAASQLRSATAISFRSRSRQICGRAGESLIVGRDRMQRYRVMDVRRLEPGELDELLGRYGKGEPGQGLEAEDTGGAEIQAIENAPDE